MRLALALSLFAFSATLTACSPKEPSGDTEAPPAPAEVKEQTPAAADVAEANVEAAPVVEIPQADGPVRQANDPYYVSAAAAVAARAEGQDIGQAKNVILFIGDGMGISTVTAARIYAGQQAGTDGESYRLAMESLPHTAFSKTYSNDRQVADSASTATAMMTGVKTNSLTLSVTSRATFDDCASEAGHGTDTIFELAERAGRATGIISTARITHATPAATYAHTVSRHWENDSDLSDEEAGCKDIASQLIDWPEGDGFEIVLGGGRRNFLTSNTPDPEDENRSGQREDGRDLVAEWVAKSDDHTVAFTLDEFRDADLAGGARVLGLFESSHMQYELDRPEDIGLEPTIEEMTRAAISRLSQDEDGYVLMVEGGRIDHAHHGSNAARALSDAVAFDRAVAAAVEATDPAETLIIVTADHSHTFIIQGYPARGNDILGIVTRPDGSVTQAADGKAYTTLAYTNGPGYPCINKSDMTEPCARPDPADTDTTADDYRQQALIPFPSETHAGEDVPVYASGPGSELVSGTIEQNEIFHIMARANGLIEAE